LGKEWSVAGRGIVKKQSDKQPEGTGGKSFVHETNCFTKKGLPSEDRVQEVRKVQGGETIVMKKRGPPLIRKARRVIDLTPAGFVQGEKSTF